LAKRQYYFSNHRFYSSLKGKKKKQRKLLFACIGFLFIIALLFIGFKWFSNSGEKVIVEHSPKSTLSGTSLGVTENQEKDDLGNLVEEKFFEGTILEPEKEEITLQSELTLVEEANENKEESLEITEEITDDKITEEKVEGITVDGCLEAGDTLYDSLIEKGIAAVEILELQEKLKSIIDCNHIPTGAKYTLKYDPEGKLKVFVYETSPIDILHINIPESDSEELQVVKEDIYKEVVKLDGIIESSLYESMLDCADSPQLALQIADIFSWQIDFLTECREGDTFKLLVEKEQRGDFYRWGKVIAVQYEGEQLSKHNAILFEDSSGHVDYYNEKGDSLRKAFLRAPLNYKYISSYFSKNRFHPILRIWRPHLAIDYAAPTGTPISTIGDGTVIFAGWENGYGNYIQIRHPNNYVTGYGHLSRYASGLKKGKKVVQGEIIGYVGATGLATGPHLDFSISKNGQRVDFLKLELPSASSVDSKYKAQFEETKNNLIAHLEGEGEGKIDLLREGK